MRAGAVLACLTLAVAEEVVTLKASNFEQHLKDNKYLLAEFYAPWCGHCKKLAPEFERAAQSLKNSGVSLGKVDATEEKDLAKSYDVKGFPTLMWFEDAQKGEYTGGRTASSIVDWVTSMTGPPVIESMEPPQPSPDKPRVVLHATSLLPEFEQVAKDNRRKATWYFQNVAKGQKIVLQHSQEDPVEFHEAIENSTVSIFFKDNALPLFGNLDGESFDKYMDEGKGIIWSLFPVTEGATLDSIQLKHRPMMSEVAKEFRGSYFVTYTDTVKFKDAIDSMLGLQQFPAIAVQKKAGDKKKYVYSGEMESSKIISFLKDVDAGKVEPQLKSEPVPPPSDDPVKVVVGSNLKAEVFTPDKDVLLEVYAPWCGHCKKLEPEYAKLAKKIKKDELGDLLAVAKIDGTTNDSPVDSIDWSSFPAIFFVKAGSDRAMVYDGERTAKGLWKYIKKHATKAQELKDRLEKRKGSKTKGEEL